MTEADLQDQNTNGSDANGGNNQSANDAIEAQARLLGWKPEDEWVGDNSGWMPADKFVETRNAQIAKADKVAQGTIDRLHNKVGELETTISRFAKYHSEVEKRAYDKALKDITARQRQAVEDGDTDAFDDLAEEAEEVRKQAVEAARVSPEPDQGNQSGGPKNPDEDPNFHAFTAKNSWYNDDVELTAYADMIAPVLARKHGGAGPAFYEDLAEEVKNKFPDKFGNQRRAQPPMAENGAADTHRSGGRTYNDLPPDAKAYCDDFVSQGLLTREQYVKDYEWE